MAVAADSGGCRSIVVVTLFPQMLESLRCGGVVGRAIAAGAVRVGAVDPRRFATDRHRTVDDAPYGGGPGMVLMEGPLRRALEAARSEAGDGARVVHLTPQGRPLDQSAVRRLAGEPGLILLAGRYEGIDERVVAAEVDEELSIGDYVLSGGELAAMVVIDAVVRLLPGVLGDAASSVHDSFTGGRLDWPHYTRPEVDRDGLRVPAVLTSGDHGAIARWRQRQAIGRTWWRRPELLLAAPPDEAERALLAEYIEQWLSGTAAVR